MSTFSSVVQKPGKKIVPKVAPRRHVQRKTATGTITNPAAVNAQENDVSLDETSITQSLPSRHEATPLEQVSSAVQGEGGTSQLQAGATLSDNVLEQESVSLLPLSMSSPRPQSVVDVEPPTHQPGEDQNLPEREPETRTSPRRSTSVPRLQELREVEQREHSILSPSSSLEQVRLAVAKPIVTTTNIRKSTRLRKSVEHADASESPRKKRKTIAKTVPPTALPQSVHDTNTSTSSAVRLRSVSQQSNRNHPPEDLLQSATERLASVSDLANSIELQTRSLRPRSQANITKGTELNNRTDQSAQSSMPASQRKRTRRRLTVEEQAAEIIANATASGDGSIQTRGRTPEHAEDYELEPTKVTMSDLCEDSKLGKKSVLETEMQANWSEILQRRREDRERAMANADKRRRKGVGHQNLVINGGESAAALAPAMAVVNGVIVVDQASREIDRSAQLQQTAVQDLDGVREDRDYYKYINQNTVGVKPGQGKHSKWDEESTERFFKGLRMFGTDFLMIANMFPGLTRKQIKTKFIREENADKSRVLECLRSHEPVQLKDYAELANKGSEEFHTLESIQKELDEQERRLREEDNQRRKREGFVTTENGSGAQEDAPEAVEDGTEGQDGLSEPSRFESMAREIVEAATAPKKRQRKTAVTNGRRGPRGGRRPEGGVEEILGNINEVAV